MLGNYPTVNLMDQAAYKRMLTGTVDTVLAFVTALLGLAVVIALVGVANTLSLSVVERTRENAVLRAVGLTRGGMRAVLAVEAVLIALVGTLLGIALGVGVSAGAMAVVARIGGDFHPGPAVGAARPDPRGGGGGRARRLRPAGAAGAGPAGGRGARRGVTRPVPGRSGR